MRRVILLVKSCVVAALVSVAAAVPSSLAADSPVAEVPVELWDRPRTGRIVMALPAVRQAVGALNAKPESRLTIRHAPGSEPVLQAEELKAWLVAHAVEPGRISLRPDSSLRQAMRLEVSSDGRQ